MKKSEFIVTFDVSGYVKQRIILNDDNLSREQFEEGLRMGKIFTQLEEGKVYILGLDGQLEKIGRVESILKENLEYHNFEVEIPDES
jgi:hypothetical protein